MEEENYQLIVAYFEKTISDEGLFQLQEWIEASTEHMEMFSETIQILTASKSYFNQAGSPEKSWARIIAHVAAQETTVEGAGTKRQSGIQGKEDDKEKDQRKDQKTRRSGAAKLQWLSYAAILLLISAIGLIAYQRNFRQKPLPVEYAQVSNPDGRQSKIVLPDNSIIYLSGGSTLRYAKKFTGAKRAVYLDGEAFFEVVHDAKRPFTVKSGNITTVVLGTSFNIKAFAAKNRVAVTVRTGKVGVMANVKGKPQLVKFLLPDEQIEINTLNGLYTFSTTDAAGLSDWRNNNFIYYNTRLKDIAASLEHHYGVKIEFTDPELGNNRLTAKFYDMSLKHVMDNLSVLAGMAYTQKDDHYFISDTYQKGGKIMR